MDNTIHFYDVRYKEEEFMGLIKATIGSVSGVMADQWKEYFYCEALPSNVLAVKGRKRNSGKSSNTKGSDNIITNGSVIAVADGQCMIIVDQGKVVELCAEPGEYTYDMSTEPSLFDGGKLSSNIKAVFANIGKRISFGGEAPKDQRIYYFNTKEITGNKYGTPNPVPFRVVDNNIGLDVDISVKCFGEYSYRITNPMLFYANVCGNVGDDYERGVIDGQLKSEMLTALQPAFAKISEMGIRYSALPGRTTELGDAINDALSAKWRDKRGIEIVAIGVSSITADPEDEKMIKELQRTAVFRNANMAGAQMVSAQSQAMVDAANNANGAAMGFMGMNMAMGAGGLNANNLFAMGAQQQAQQPVQPAPQAAPQAPAAGAWKCSCGATATGKFCPECGSPKPAPVAADGWTCSCGAVNKGKFCAECGSPKPAGVPQYKCDKCGWEPADKAHPPKFCPECGDPFDDGDIV